MILIVWIINDIHIEFNDIHWEGCLHITRRPLSVSRGRSKRIQYVTRNAYNRDIKIASFGGLLSMWLENKP